MPESLTRRIYAAKFTCGCPASRRNRVRLQIGMVSGFDRNRVRHPVGITVRHHSESSLLVSLADKTYNAEAILFDYRELGDSLWDRFNGGADGTRWYYGALADVFAVTMPGRLSDRMARAVAGFSG